MVSRRWLARELAKQDKTLVGFWPLQGNWLDYSGGSNHGYILTGNVSPFVTDYWFASDILWCGSVPDASFTPLNRFSISLWIRWQIYTNPANIMQGPFSPPGFTSGPLLSKLDNSGNGYQIDLTTDSSDRLQLKFTLYQAGGHLMSALFTLDDASVNIIQQIPFHIVITYNGSRNASGIRLYVNGMAKTALSVVNALGTTNNAATANLTFAGSSVTGIRLNYVCMKLVRIYKRLLSSVEVAKLYYREKDTYHPRRHARKHITANVNNNITLFIHGPPTKTSSIPLYIDGFASISSGIPLYIRGSLFASSGIPLYIHGITSRAQGLNLFVNSKSNPFSNTVTLFEFGTPSGVLGAINKGLRLFISGTGYANHLNMYMRGNPIGVGLGNMNMYIIGGGMPIYKTNTLFVCNNQSGVISSRPLSIIGGGAVPLPPASNINGSLNLFIKRWPSNALPLFLECASPISKNTSLYTKGTASQQGSVTLAISKTIGIQNSNTPFFTSGW